MVEHRHTVQVRMGDLQPIIEALVAALKSTNADFIYGATALIHVLTAGGEHYGVSQTEVAHMVATYRVDGEKQS